MKHTGKTSLAESRAIIAIACVLILAISLPMVIDRVLSPTGTPAPTLEGLTVDSTDRGAQAATKSYTTGKDKYYSNQRAFHSGNQKRAASKPSAMPYSASEIKCQSFDPNSVGKEDLVSMGVSQYVAGNLVRFRESGAVFRKKEDIIKVYGMDSTMFSALSSCIDIKREIVATGQKKERTALDINTAGLDQWKQLPGIGDVLASRIVNYRERLGGFYAIRQVGETYGLPPETFTSITDKLTLSSAPKTIDINTASLDALAAHPYISQKQAETIINYRTHHGNFTKLQEMMKIYSLQREWLERMQPYLTCEQCKVADDMVDAIE